MLALKSQFWKPEFVMEVRSCGKICFEGFIWILFYFKADLFWFNTHVFSINRGRLIHKKIRGKKIRIKICHHKDLPPQRLGF
jgi:hypothetical protein